MSYLNEIAEAKRCATMQWIRDGAKDSLQQKARISAHREIEVLSHALTKAVQWGYLDLHPFKG